MRHILENYLKRQTSEEQRSIKYFLDIAFHKKISKYNQAFLAATGMNGSNHLTHASVVAKLVTVV